MKEDWNKIALRNNITFITGKDETSYIDQLNFLGDTNIILKWCGELLKILKPEQGGNS